MRLAYLATQLRISFEELNRLLVEIVQNGETTLKIDQVNGVLAMPVGEYKNIDASRCQALDSMCKQIESLHNSMLEKIY